jgi:pyrroline-5-carboxylate reductase
MKITFIGGGNMALALIGGLRKQGFPRRRSRSSSRFEESREKLTETFGVRCTPAVDAAALDCEVLVLAVKPQQMREAVAPLRGKLGTQLVVSIAAGLRMADMARWLGGYEAGAHHAQHAGPDRGRHHRLCADPSVDRDGRANAEKMLKAVGSTVWIADEEQMDAVTAVSGSGPAYVFYFLEAMEAARASGSGLRCRHRAPAEHRNLPSAPRVWPSKAANRCRPCASA